MGTGASPGQMLAPDSLITQALHDASIGGRRKIIAAGLASGLDIATKM